MGGGVLTIQGMQPGRCNELSDSASPNFCSQSKTLASFSGLQPSFCRLQYEKQRIVFFIRCKKKKLRSGAWDGATKTLAGKFSSYIKCSSVPVL